MICTVCTHMLLYHYGNGIVGALSSFGMNDFAMLAKLNLCWAVSYTVYKFGPISYVCASCAPCPVVPRVGPVDTPGEYCSVSVD